MLGEKDRKHLIEELGAWPYTYGKVATVRNQPTDAWIRGTWDDVRRSRMSHLIDDDTFLAIAQAAPNLPVDEFPHWLTRSRGTTPAA